MTPNQERDVDSFVSRNTICCLSGMIYDVGQHPDEAAKVFDLDLEEIYGWFSVPDYEEAVSDTLRNLDLTDLLEECDEVGFRDDALGTTTAAADRAAAILAAQEAYAKEVAEGGDEADRSDLEALQDMNVEEWAIYEATKDQTKEYEVALRSYIEDRLDDDERQEFCDRHNVDIYEYDREVFEHWAVDPWFGEKLREHGELVFDFANFTVWGRCTTGQAISMDYVVQQIWKELNR